MILDFKICELTLQDLYQVNIYEDLAVFSQTYTFLSRKGGAYRIHTKSISEEEGRTVGSDTLSNLSDNFGPRTIQILPANFLVDPDSVRSETW